jgi:hypothetical protein
MISGEESVSCSGARGFFASATALALHRLDDDAAAGTGAYVRAVSVSWIASAWCSLSTGRVRHTM